MSIDLFLHFNDFLLKHISVEHVVLPFSFANSAVRNSEISRTQFQTYYHWSILVQLSKYCMGKILSSNYLVVFEILTPCVTPLSEISKVSLESLFFWWPRPGVDPTLWMRPTLPTGGLLKGTTTLTPRFFQHPSAKTRIRDGKHAARPKLWAGTTWASAWW